MTMTTATLGRSPAVEDAVAEVWPAVRETGLHVTTHASHTAAPLGARQDAVPLCTPAMRGVERGPAHWLAQGERVTVTDQ